MNALRSNRKAAVAAIIAGDLLVLMLGWFLLIGPQRATAREIAQATAATEAQVAEASRPIEVDPSAVQQPQPAIRTADLYSLAKAMPSDTDTPDLLLELSLLARQSGVTLTSIAPSPPTPPALGATTAYDVLPVSLAVSGDFYTLTDFLYRLRTLVGIRNGQLQTAGRLYSVAQVGLTGAGSRDLTASISLNAYVWDSAAAAAAAAAASVAPPVASTDTTTDASSN